jgi:site-specific DNA-methyltransferase (adenine-specific)
VPKPFLSATFEGHTCEIFQEDAGALLDSLPPEHADIIFLDPPFNIGKRYALENFSDRDDPDLYFGWLTSILRKAVSRLRPGGALYFYHLPSVAYRVAAMLDHHLLFRHWIAIAMKNNFVRGKRLYPAHYALLYFTKGEPEHFSRPKLAPKVCRHCGENIKDYGGYRRIIEEKGLNLSDFWEDLSPVRHASTKTRSANELPATFFSRIMQISGHPGGVYVDPFMGSGGGVLAALDAQMAAVACDASPESCDLAAQRIQARGGQVNGREGERATSEAIVLRAAHA